MDQEFISDYFLKATALVLASAGIESVEKQALYVLAKEAERYAQQLGKHASRLAESSRRCVLTAGDIKAAAMMISPQQATLQQTTPSFVSSESKRRLRSSVESHEVLEHRAISSADFSFPQFVSDTLTNGDDMITETDAKKVQCLPEWLQHELDKRPQTEQKSQMGSQKDGGKSGESRRLSVQTAEPNKASGPLELITSLVLAEEESRNILTKKTRVDSRDNNAAK